MKVIVKGESEEYRKPRDQLLEAEIALKDQTERLAALRRQLPVGAVVGTDYVFRDGLADLRDESPGNTDYFIACPTTWRGLMFRIKAATEGQAPGPLFMSTGLAY